MDTIVALSSGRPPAAIAIVRLSGPAALDAASRLAGPLPPPRMAAVRALRGHDGALLDRAVLLVFPGPATATGEDLVEFHCHGGRAVVAAVERALLAHPGIRRAEPGEFTRRALANGRIDLAEAQGLADLLTAETERQRRAAVDAAEGRVSKAVREWMDRIALLAAQVEARLDFADEDDVVRSSASDDAVGQAMIALAGQMQAVLAAPPVDRLRDGIRVVIGGPPNAGKSTLINLLADRDVAIVSPIAGTTRDRIEATVAVAGIPFVIVDTAGLTATDDRIESIGIERANAAIDAAEILLWLGESMPPRDAIWVHARADLAGRAALPAGRSLATAASDPGSIDRLWALLVERAETLVPPTDALTLSQAQHATCAAAAASIARPAADDLIRAEQLRTASNALAAILGIGATEAMLDALFGRFCIGK